MSEETQATTFAKAVPGMEDREKSPSVRRQGSGKEGSPSFVRAKGGPKTPQGKQRSSANSLKHGIFAKAVLVKGESPAEYGRLLNELEQQFRPETTVERIVVEHLATILWRLRRVVLAESGEVNQN